MTWGGTRHPRRSVARNSRVARQHLGVSRRRPKIVILSEAEGPLISFFFFCSRSQFHRRYLSRGVRRKALTGGPSTSVGRLGSLLALRMTTKGSAFPRHALSPGRRDSAPPMLHTANPRKNRTKIPKTPAENPPPKLPVLHGRKCHHNRCLCQDHLWERRRNEGKTILWRHLVNSVVSPASRIICEIWYEKAFHKSMIGSGPWSATPSNHAST
jgi:hypothetical protein